MRRSVRRVVTGSIVRRSVRAGTTRRATRRPGGACAPRAGPASTAPRPARPDITARVALKFAPKILMVTSFSSVFLISVSYT